MTDITDRQQRIAGQTSAADVLPKQPVNSEAAATPATGQTKLLTAFQIEDALNMPPVEWLVENLIAEQTITIVYAEPKAGKSNVFSHLAASMALGLDWLEMKTIESPVLWIDLDMGHIGAMRRMVQIASGLSDKLDNQTFKNLHIITPETFKLNNIARFDFFSGTSVEDLREYIIANDIKICFVDTLSQVRGASNENDAGDMSKVFETVKTIRDITGCAFVIIHHSTKPSQFGGRQTARGSSAIYAEADLVINITKDDRDDNHQLTMILESARYIEPRKIGLYQSWQPRFDENDQPIKENEKQLQFYKLETRDLQEDQKTNTFETYQKILSYIGKHAGCNFQQIYDAKDETGIKSRNKLKALLDELTPESVVVNTGQRGAKLYYLAQKND